MEKKSVPNGNKQTDTQTMFQVTPHLNADFSTNLLLFPRVFVVLSFFPHYKYNLLISLPLPSIEYPFPLLKPPKMASLSCSSLPLLAFFLLLASSAFAGSILEGIMLIFETPFA